MNIVVRNTPANLALRIFGNEHGSALGKIFKKRSPEDIYEIVGMAREDPENIIKLYGSSSEIDFATRNGSYGFDLYSAPCFTHQIEADRITKEALNYQPEIEEGIHQCGKCRGRKTIQLTVQDRSGDEGATTYIMCVGCQARWKSG